MRLFSFLRPRKKSFCSDFPIDFPPSPSYVSLRYSTCLSCDGGRGYFPPTLKFLMTFDIFSEVRGYFSTGRNVLRNGRGWGGGGGGGIAYRPTLLFFSIGTPTRLFIFLGLFAGIPPSPKWSRQNIISYI